MSESKHTSEPFIVTLNAVLVDGSYDDIIAIGIVANAEEGEFWFNNKKPIDGTQVDYVLHDIKQVFAAPELLEACKAQRDAIDRLFALLISKDDRYFPTKSGQLWEAIQQGNTAIALAEKGCE